MSITMKSIEHGIFKAPYTESVSYWQCYKGQELDKEARALRVKYPAWVNSVKNRKIPLSFSPDHLSCLFEHKAVRDKPPGTKTSVCDGYWDPGDDSTARGQVPHY